MSETVMASRRMLREQTAEEIRVLLARRQLSAAELARRAGIKQSTLARRMTGETAFDLDDLELIAAALGVAVTDLLPASARHVDPVSVRDQAPTGPYSGQDGVTVLYPEMPERATRKRVGPPDNRPNGHPEVGAAPGNRRTGRVPRPGSAKRP